MTGAPPASSGEQRDAPAGQEVVALTASDFLLLALCVLAVLSALRAGAARLFGARRGPSAHPKSA